MSDKNKLIFKNSDNISTTKITLNNVTKLKKGISLLFFISYIICLILGVLVFNFSDSMLLEICFIVFTILCIVETIIIYSGLVSDITASKKRAEEALEQAAIAKEARNIFFSNISHEFRTPINIMMGMNEMIIRETESRDIAEYAKNSALAGKTLENLVNNLLAYSRITSGHFLPMRIQFSLFDFLEDFIAICKKDCKRNNIDLDSYINSDIPCDVIGDSGLLNQLLANILSIATYNNEKEYINLSFNWENITQKQGKLIVTMEYSGNSISDENLYFLYNKTPIPTDIDRLNGIDFDLTIIKHLLEVLDGSIEVSKIIDNRSTFNLSIPYEVLPENTYSATTEADHGNIGTFIAPNARILVVDDTEMNLKVISLLLKRTQIEIDSATNGIDALKLLEDNIYNFIFIDYMMPEMNGVELLSIIKNKHPDIYKNVPIYALSANTNTETRELITSSGFAGYLPKPVEGNLLELIVRNNLPQNLVITSLHDEATKTFTPAITNKFKALLSEYDIVLSEGLKYMNGDLLQYKTVAGLIYKNYEKTRKNVENLYSDNNIKDLGIVVHALKGNAKFIGAIYLYNIAMSIESRASKGEELFVTQALPLLYYQWEKTIKGLKEFLMEFDNLGLEPKTNPNPIKSNSEDYIEALIEYTDNFEPEPALQLIKQLLTQDLSANDSKLLSQAAEYLEELEYDEAMRIFKEMIS